MPHCVIVWIHNMCQLTSYELRLNLGNVSSIFGDFRSCATMATSSSASRAIALIDWESISSAAARFRSSVDLGWDFQSFRMILLDWKIGYSDLWILLFCWCWSVCHFRFKAAYQLAGCLGIFIHSLKKVFLTINHSKNWFCLWTCSAAGLGWVWEGLSAALGRTLKERMKSHDRILEASVETAWRSRYGWKGRKMSCCECLILGFWGPLLGYSYK